MLCCVVSVLRCIVLCRVELWRVVFALVWASVLMLVVLFCVVLSRRVLCCVMLVLCCGCVACSGFVLSCVELC